MTIIFPITYAMWFLSEFLLGRLRRSNANDIKGADKNSLAIIWIVVIPSIAVASYIASSIRMPMVAGEWIRYAGLALMILGIVFRMLVIKTLGRMFTVDVTIREGHKLKKDGFYKIVRHPSYSASLISFMGFGISLNNWISFFLVAVASSSVFLYRIRIEEDALIKQFGSEYTDYRKSTKAIIPFIY